MSQRQALPLWNALQEAATFPETADLKQLWETLDKALAVLDAADQLAVAAEAIAQLAQLFQERSQLTFELLDAATSAEGPIMAEDAFIGFVRQSMHVDFSEFIEPPPNLTRKPYDYHEHSHVNADRSVVGVVSQDALLQVLDAQASEQEAEAAYRQVLSVAHAEDVSTWSGAIAAYLQQQTADSVCLSQLQQALHMPLVELWLGLLLGGYRMEAATVKETSGFEDASRAEQDSHWFYGSELWVDCRAKAAQPEPP